MSEPATNGEGGFSVPGIDRMTPRDFFATDALTGMLAHAKRYKPRAEASSNWHEAIAEEAYQIADAMMVARRSPSGEAR